MFHNYKQDNLISNHAAFLI